MIETIESPHIHTANSENFNSLVLDNSRKGPVLVNFWSRKAGPCLRQYPVLDKLVYDFGGRLLLINIDIDNEFIVTKEYGIKSVPTLKLFRENSVVETMHGYQSENDLTKVLENYVVRDSDTTLAQAIQVYTKGEQQAAYKMITDAIVSDPGNPRLPLAMCKLLKYEQRYDEALKLVETLPKDIRSNSDVIQFYNLLSFYVEAGLGSGMESLIARIEATPDDLEARQQLVAKFVIQASYEEALLQLVKIMDIDQSYNSNYAQQAMLKLFSLLGKGNPLVKKHRSNLRRYTH